MHYTKIIYDSGSVRIVIYLNVFASIYNVIHANIQYSMCIYTCINCIYVIQYTHYVMYIQYRSEIERVSSLMKAMSVTYIQCMLPIHCAVYAYIHVVYIYTT